MKKLAIAVLLAATALVGMRLGLRIYFEVLARRNQYIVQAAYDYRAEHGMWPQGFDDLVPDYLSTRPTDPLVLLDEDGLDVPADLPHTGVVYSFRRNEGWSANGDFGTGPLPLPKLAATRPAVTGVDGIRARLAEYDRRITAAPVDSPYYAYRDYTEKIAYLVSLGRKADAIKTCRAAAKAFPDWWRPPMTEAMIADSDQRAQSEAQLRAWVEMHPTFIHYWYLSRYYRETGRHDMAVAALRQAVKHSLSDNDRDGQWVPDAYAFDAAQYACQQRVPDLVLDITRVWDSPRGVYTYHNNNLDAFKAAAELQLGKFSEAEADLARVTEAGKTQGLWAKNLDQLHGAITAKDQSFVYDAGSLNSGWTLFSAPE